MISTTRSLMDFVDTPILVGDPDGRTVYVNSAFETDFLMASEDAVGEPLANLFEGGGRESVLASVARVCGDEGSETVRFPLRAEDRGYDVMASPVESEGGRVGVVLLLVRESEGDSRLQGLRREVLAGLDELGACLANVASHAGGPDADTQRIAVADGVRVIERMRKWADEAVATLKGGRR